MPLLDSDVPSYVGLPLEPEAVRWHLPEAEFSDLDAIEETCRVIASSVTAAWRTVEERAVEGRGTDSALYRLVRNLRLTGVDAVPAGGVLSLYVSSRGIHDLLHARTGARLAEALSVEAGISLSVADCDSRLRWTRGIWCGMVPPKPVPAEPDWEAIHAHQEAVIDGRVVEEHRQAASNRLILALERRLGLPYEGAHWQYDPDMCTIRVSAPDARRLIALGVPARPQLGEHGSTVSFTLTERECAKFTEVVIAAAGRPPQPSGSQR
ncbi:hypothetical protein ABZ352_18955 [Streptomyces griseofuscus]|uniref:hypothetical protein n=1 Tax=Streptomyces griseofuscus TaxID=146922 RepID=UPI003404CED5